MDLSDFENGEQLENVETSMEDNKNSSLAGKTEEDCQKLEESKAERGVPIGKFKSVDDLYQAYNNLQSEFTRKSQKLAELEKDKTSHVASDEDRLETEFREFLLKNKEADLYSEEIKAKVLQDDYLKKQEKPFEKVWANMIYKKIIAPERAKEPFVQNLILQDDELKNLIIENYVKQLQDNKTPIVMSSGAGERVTKLATPKPDSFEDAKKVVLDLFS